MLVWVVVVQVVIVGYTLLVSGNRECGNQVVVDLPVPAGWSPVGARSHTIAGGEPRVPAGSPAFAFAFCAGTLASYSVPSSTIGPVVVRLPLSIRSLV